MDLISVGMMQSLITRHDTIFRSTDLTSLQSEIRKQLIVERSEMLMIARA